MNIRELRQKLYEVTEAAGGIRAWAEANDMAFSHPAAVIRGDAKPGRKILKALGLRKAYSEKKTTVMKFEDITN
jgi:hypothetical protein